MHIHKKGAIDETYLEPSYPEPFLVASVRIKSIPPSPNTEETEHDWRRGNRNKQVDKLTKLDNEGRKEKKEFNWVRDIHNNEYPPVENDRA